MTTDRVAAGKARAAWSAAKMVLLGLTLLLGMSKAAAFASDDELSYAQAAALDGSGTLWAFRRENEGRVSTYDGRDWKTRSDPLPAEGNPIPLAAATLSDGAVACVWWLSDQKFCVTRHLGKESRLLGTVAGKLPNGGSRSAPFADSRGRLWITGPLPQIYRADDKCVTLAHEITPAELEAPTKAKREYNEIHSTEDGAGRIWVWSEAADSRAATFHGVLIFDGDRVEQRDPCATLKKGARILAIARADERHMWLTVANDGLYRVDIDSLALEPQTPPSPKALCCVHELFVDGGDLYAVQSGDAGEILWRRRAGTWQEVVPRLEEDVNPWHPRFWLPLREGLLVGSYGAGPWFVPKEGKAAQISWRENFPVVDVRSMIRLGDDTFFACGMNGTCFQGPLTLPPIGRDNPRVENLDTESGWIVDAAQHPWVVSRSAPDTLRERNGDRWVTHAVPPAKAKDGSPRPREGAPNLLADADGGVWADYSGGQEGVARYDTRTGQWQVFDGLSDAYLALRENPPHFVSSINATFDPQYSAERLRIAYRDGVTGCNYYDGFSWHRLQRSEITGIKESDRAIGPPWFDAQGRLCVNIRDHQTWRRSNAGTWTKTAFESHYPTDVWSEGGHGGDRRVTPPAGCITSSPDSIVQDNLGTYWLTWNHELYRSIPGRSVRVFAPDEPNPFRIGHELRRAFVDPAGNAFLLADSYTSETFMIQGRPLLHATIAVEHVGADGIRARFQTNATPPVQFDWRLDDGPRNTTPDSTLMLDRLSNGLHTLSVTAIGSDLEPAANPAVARFEITVDPERQLADLVGQLSDRDDERRSVAVRALARQGSRAVPALQKARETADADQQWWIDATLQEIERNAKAAATKDGPAPSDDGH